MGKWSKYNKNFQNSWLSDKEFSKWIEEVGNDSEKAYCKLCKVYLRAHKTDLTKHASTAKHAKNAACITSPSQQRLTTIFSEKCKVTKLELKLAAFVACHTSIRNVDHLTDLVKNEFPSSSSSSMAIYIKSLKMHRSKCSAIIKNVIAPALLQELIEDIKNHIFSLIIDESTDISCVKHLCLCIRYYNSKDNRIVSQFLGLIPVTVTTAEALHDAVTHFLSDVGIDIQKCFAIATDGASNLCGINNSLYTRMKKDNPNIYSASVILFIYPVHTRQRNCLEI
ncbi:uncharacterized protein [Centruroides vittatus]|uniref:uncharacterized protein n=2 Tax=Centruroides vittatus TaxID=120091 RepID=UPI00350F1188